MSRHTRRPSRTAPAMLGIAAVLGATPIHAQEPIALSRTGGPIVIDGVINERAWSLIPPLHITQKVPVEGDPPSQPTEIRIGYDDDFIYLSGRLYDAEPHRIVANTKKRDDFTENTEWVGLLIDTYDDRENALGFWVTPTGAKLDVAISNDSQNDSEDINTDWNGYWDAATTRDDTGWFAEIRIPFSSLPFAIVEGRTIMGITAWRYIARTDETAIYPPRGLAAGSSFRPSLTQRFAFHDLRPTRALTVTPYVLGGRSTNNTPAESNGPFESATEYDREAGIDARLAMGGNMTLDLTVNTDFAQVEVDDQQANLTRLNLFFPEKRLFFQERASLFNFSFGGTDKLFHSRRIGIDDGKPTRIYGGVRAVAKFGGWETGFLTMQTGVFSANTSRNYSVFRLKRNVFNDNSTLGILLTNRMDFDGQRNTAYGIDGTIRILGENFVSFRWAQNLTSSSARDLTIFDRARLLIELTDRSPRGFTYKFGYGRSGSGFDPAVGFQSRENFARFDYAAAYNVFPGARSILVQYGPYAEGSFVWGNASGDIESRGAQLGLKTFSKSGWTSDLYVRSDVEALTESLDLSGNIRIQPGRHPFTSLGGSLNTPSSYRMAGTVAFSTGGFFDRRKTTVSLSPTITITPDLAVSGRYEHNRITVSGSGSNNDPVTVRLTTVGVQYFFSTRLSVNALVQHNNVEKVYVGSFRLRYNRTEGRDFYLVFNGDANHDRRRFDPALPMSNRTTLQIKYSHALRL